MINYYLLTKPGIILGNLITMAAGFLLASKGQIYIGLFLAALIGLAFIVASACAFNNYIDRKIDQKMERTKQRPLAAGLISGKQALIFAVLLVIIGNLILLAYTNLLTLVIADTGFLIYVVPYSLWKYHTIYGTAIGSIAGAVPPIVGYCAVSHQLDLGALLLFIILVLWQMPHFFAIAIYRFDDYFAVGTPVLPIKKGMFATKIRTLVYICALLVATACLTAFHYTGYIYLTLATVTGLIWLGLGIIGLKRGNDKFWGQQMFRFSIVMIAVICFAIPFDTV